MAQFRQRIRTSLANQHLQKALDLNAERRVTRRINALETLPDWRERRQRAHAVRAEVIEHLDQYLDQFIASAEANGVTVHRAKDEAEAVQLILQIVKFSPQRSRNTQGEKEITFVPQGELRGKEILVAKSKSMVTEEINLNHALEKENIRVVETDLGEFIVQLRGERPSHIITPALHLRRQDVGDLFQKKLGIEYTDDIHTLTNTARKVLREVFLTADVGITGANFAIAEEGAICLVTNEGNGRMVTTLPPIHIALIGMERVVRNLDDLALMISLLPRSATGQKITVYTQIIHNPLDGQQRHFIILDNGRSRLRNSPLKESLYCIRCGSCLNACPVFREIGGHAYKSVYGGPIGSVISAGLFGSEFIPLAQASSLCGACKDACPVDIDLPKLLVRVRAGGSPIANRQPQTNGLSSLSSTTLKIYSRVARHPRLFILSQKFSALASYLLYPRSKWMRLPALTGWGYSKDFPRFAGKTFRDRWKDLEASKDTSARVNTHADKSVSHERDISSASAPQNDTEKVERFTKELTAVHGHVHKTEDPAQSIAEFLHTRGIDRIHLEPGILDDGELIKAGIAVSRESDPAIRVGVTKAICGLADTGSILEADGEGDPLHASLLPEIHLAVLYTSRIYPSLENAIHLTRDTKSAVFITGPSATGDIESVHTIGVHGPGEMHVFLVDD
ncbi:MAG TPA: LUD domain-containing protein [Anaerolineales bacterium]|nr:LUD domain-containing protein [Anaerolineales bacterium]